MGAVAAAAGAAEAEAPAAAAAAVAAGGGDNGGDGSNTGGGSAGRTNTNGNGGAGKGSQAGGGGGRGAASGTTRASNNPSGAAGGETFTLRFQHNGQPYLVAVGDVNDVETAARTCRVVEGMTAAQWMVRMQLIEVARVRHEMHLECDEWWWRDIGVRAVRRPGPVQVSADNGAVPGGAGEWGGGATATDVSLNLSGTAGVVNWAEGVVLVRATINGQRLQGGFHSYEDVSAYARRYAAEHVLDAETAAEWERVLLEQQVLAMNSDTGLAPLSTAWDAWVPGAHAHAAAIAATTASNGLGALRRQVMAWVYRRRGVWQPEMTAVHAARLLGWQQERDGHLPLNEDGFLTVCRWHEGQWHSWLVTPGAAKRARNEAARNVAHGADLTWREDADAQDNLPMPLRRQARLSRARRQMTQHWGAAYTEQLHHFSGGGAHAWRRVWLKISKRWTYRHMATERDLYPLSSAEIEAFAWRLEGRSRSQSPDVEPPAPEMRGQHHVARDTAPAHICQECTRTSANHPSCGRCGRSAAAWLKEYQGRPAPTLCAHNPFLGDVYTRWDSAVLLPQSARNTVLQSVQRSVLTYLSGPCCTGIPAPYLVCKAWSHLAANLHRRLRCTFLTEGDRRVHLSKQSVRCLCVGATPSVLQKLVAAAAGHLPSRRRHHPRLQRRRPHLPP